jgi:hypothetical protein
MLESKRDHPISFCLNKIPKPTLRRLLRLMKHDYITDGCEEEVRGRGLDLPLAPKLRLVIPFLALCATHQWVTSSTSTGMAPSGLRMEMAWPMFPKSVMVSSGWDFSGVSAWKSTWLWSTLSR